MLATWVKVDDGEYNEQHAVVGAVKLVLFSDISEKVWSVTIDGGEMIDLDATNEFDARAEALRELKLR